MEEISYSKIKGLYNMCLETLSEKDGIYYSIFMNTDPYDINPRSIDKEAIKGNELSFFFYPSKIVYSPFKREDGVYYLDSMNSIRYIDGKIYFLQVNFNDDELNLFRYDISKDLLDKLVSLRLSKVNLYNIGLHIEPLMITSQYDSLEVYYPERFSLNLKAHESFAFRKDDYFYFYAWEEKEYTSEVEGEIFYECIEKYIIKDIFGDVIEEGVGGLHLMSDGEIIIV